MNKSDRCDNCNAQAFVMWSEIKTARDLLFCKHDSDKFSVALLAQGFVVLEDSSDQINVKPSVSANAD